MEFDKETDDYDNPWKEMLSHYFKDFMYFFFPWAAKDIDWNCGYTFLDKELQQVSRDAELGKRYADKLVRVFRKDQTEAWVLIHIEIQAQKESDFPKRMYVYNYRIFDQYNRHTVSMAILADDHAHWKPDRYQEQLWRCKIGFQFPVVKLLDYRKTWEKLEKSKNPFAIAVMAHLKTMETRQNDEARKSWKVLLIRNLYEAGYQKKDIILLFAFIDWIMRLPQDLEKNFWTEISQIEEEKHMPYITSVERMGIQKGIEQGILQGMQQGMQKGIQQGMQKGIQQGMQKGIQQGMQKGIQQGMQKGIQQGILDILTLRFMSIPKSVIKKIQAVSNPEVLNALLKKAVQAESLEGFVQGMDT
ncbi:MAG: cytosolic protein [Desulfobacterales bacterium]|nr:cytosolic protein [Desulfobacterales bacterium]